MTGPPPTRSRPNPNEELDENQDRLSRRVLSPPPRICPQADTDDWPAFVVDANTDLSNGIPLARCDLGREI